MLSMKKVWVMGATLAMAGCAVVVGDGAGRQRGAKSPEQGGGAAGTAEALFRRAGELNERADALEARGGGADQVTALRRQAREAYRDLIRDHPTSPMIPRVYVTFGDEYFERGEMNVALQFYDRALQHTSSDIQAYALYRSAWCAMNLQDHRQALDRFVRTLTYLRDNPSAPNADRLTREVTRDLVRPYAEVGTPSRAVAFFRRVAPGEELKMLEQLAVVYADSGRHREAIACYRLAMASDDTHERLCQWQLGAARSVLEASSRPEQQLELQRIVDLMEVYSQGQHPVSAVTACRRGAAQMMVERASSWHDEAQATRSPQITRAAHRLIELGLARFSDLDHLSLSGFTSATRPTRARLCSWRDDLARHLGAP